MSSKSAFILLVLTCAFGNQSAAAQGLRPSSYPPPEFSPTAPLSIPPPPLESIQIGDLSGMPETLSVPTPLFDEPSEPSQFWYMPWTYIPLDGWVNTAEFGVNGAAGNSDSFAMQAGSRFKRKTKATVFELKMTHNRAKANSIETQNNSLLFADWERLSNNSPWTLFSKFGLEADEFRAFDIRLNVNGGVGYQWISTDALTFKTRFGSGVSREFGGPDNAWKPEAVFGATYEHQVTKRHKLLGKIDYYPNWGNFADYRVVADAGWEYLLDDDGNLSFKLGMTDRYDSTPNGLNPNDINYNALLLYKF